MIHATETLY